jgi:hypothetical protein
LTIAFIERPWCKLRRASRARKEAARRPPRPTTYSAGAICGRRDAVKLAKGRQLGCRAGHQPADSFTPKLAGGAGASSCCRVCDLPLRELLLQMRHCCA